MCAYCMPHNLLGPEDERMSEASSLLLRSSQLKGKQIIRVKRQVNAILGVYTVGAERQAPLTLCE